MSVSNAASSSSSDRSQANGGFGSMRAGTVAQCPGDDRLIMDPELPFGSGRVKCPTSGCRAALSEIYDCPRTDHRRVSRHPQKKTAIARLACARDNQPYVVPVHVYFDGDCLYGFATLGQKIEWMRENPRVCVQVDDIRDRFHWATVVVLGQYEELLHMPSDEEARRRAQ